ncbi:MAG: thioredoxin domain-containing protein [Desulfobacterota bacterium]|nr:thioredoxin domain-containing protein [Thermodesulfobacteriota bacterium]
MQERYSVVTLYVVCCLSVLACSLPYAHAEVQWSILGTLQLDDTPKDIMLSRDGATAYVLTERSILLVSLQEKKVVEQIPLSESFQHIALSADESVLYLTQQNSRQITMLQVSRIYDIDIGKSPVIGNPKAPVSVVAFLDFQCPYCARVYPTLKQLCEKYPSDVKLIIKHYPLPMHRFAEHAAKAALAAAKQKKYDKLSEILFSNFQNINEQTITTYAQSAGLDMNKFTKDMADTSIADILREDRDLAQKLQVRAVPTLFVNGMLAKARSLEALSQMVDGALQKKRSTH